MKNRHFNLHDGKMGAAIAVQVIPRSNRNEIAEILNDGTVKVRLNCPSKDEQINQALLGYLAQILDIAVNQLEIVAGLESKDKLVTILELGSDDVQRKILKNLS